MLAGMAWQEKDDVDMHIIVKCKTSFYMLRF